MSWSYIKWRSHLTSSNNHHFNIIDDRKGGVVSGDMTLVQSFMNIRQLFQKVLEETKRGRTNRHYYVTWLR
jgi:hypothetical protein